MRSTGKSVVNPAPPKSWTASVVTDIAVSEAKHLDADAISPMFATPRSARAAAAPALPVKRIKAPAWLPGLDFSDHLNYWHFGYSAVLLTDTAFYRNKHYHQATDTLDRLDLRRLGLAVDALLSITQRRVDRLD